MKKQSVLAASLLLFVGGWHTYALADTLASSVGIFAYPSQGQSAEQQSTDDYECFAYAKNQTGYDPMNPPQVVAQAPDQGPQGERLAGAARGAVGGAAIGAIAGDTGEGAAIGATLGLLRGGRQSRMNQQQSQQQAQQAAQQQMYNMEGTFKNAYGACIEGRGYSVKY